MTGFITGESCEYVLFSPFAKATRFLLNTDSIKNPYAERRSLAGLKAEGVNHKCVAISENIQDLLLPP